MEDVYDILAQALKPSGAGVVTRAERALIEVRGPDAVEFLHRICSQDVESLDASATAAACFLDPKGRLIATVQLGRTAESVWLETAAETVDSLAEHLDRFHFTERLEILRPPQDGPEAWVCAERIGPDAWSVGELAAGIVCERDLSVRIVAERFGMRWTRVHGSAELVDRWVASLPDQPLDRELAGCLRLASATLIVGTDTDDRTIALEAPVEDHISSTKGCYTGQEIVARIHTYGHVNRNLVLLHLDSAASIDTGESLHETDDGDAVGRVTTSYVLPSGSSRLACGYLPRDFATPGTALWVAAPTQAVATVVAYGG